MPKLISKIPLIKILVIGIFLALFLIPEHTWAVYQELTEHINNDSVKNAWSVMLGLVDIVAALALIIIAFANILRINIEVYDIKRTLPGLIVGVIVANFSFFLCYEAVKFTQSITNFFNHLPLGIGEGIMTKLWHYTSSALHFDNNPVSANPEDFLDGLNTLWNGLSLLVKAIVLVVAAIPMLIIWLLIALLLYIRSLVVVFLIILSPVVAIAYFLPFTKQYTSTWLDWFIKWLLVGPLVFALVWAMSVFTEVGNVWSGLAYVIVFSIAILTIPFAFVSMGNIPGIAGNLLKKHVGSKAMKKMDRIGSWAAEKTESIPLVGGAVKSLRNIEAGDEASHQFRLKARQESIDEITKVVQKNSLMQWAWDVSDGGKNVGKIKDLINKNDGTALMWKALYRGDVEGNKNNLTVADMASQVKSDQDIFRVGEDGKITNKIQAEAEDDLEAAKALHDSFVNKGAIDLAAVDTRDTKKSDEAKTWIDENKTVTRKEFGPPQPDMDPRYVNALDETPNFGNIEALGGGTGEPTAEQAEAAEIAGETALRLAKGEDREGILDALRDIQQEIKDGKYNDNRSGARARDMLGLPKSYDAGLTKEAVDINISGLEAIARLETRGAELSSITYDQVKEEIKVENRISNHRQNAVRQFATIEGAGDYSANFSSVVNAETGGNKDHRRLLRTLRTNIAAMLDARMNNDERVRNVFSGRQDVLIKEILTQVENESPKDVGDLDKKLKQAFEDNIDKEI